MKTLSIFTSSLGQSLPSRGRLTILSATSIPSMTSPKAVYCLSRKVLSVVTIKNCEPALSGSIGDGTLESFVLTPVGKSLVYGTFQTDLNFKSENYVPVVKISGVTTYDVLFTSIDVPFVFYPSEKQASEFIHQD